MKFLCYFVFLAIITCVKGSTYNHNKEIRDSDSWDSYSEAVTIERELAESLKSRLPDEYPQSIRKWRQLLVSDDLDETNPYVRKYVSKLSAEAEALRESLDTSANRTYLWPAEYGQSRAADITTQFRKLTRLTLAYGTKGTKYYKNETILAEVKNGLDFMVKPGRYDGKQYNGNWWNWQIGTPSHFLDIIMIIKDELDSEKVKHYTDIISVYVSSLNLRLTSQNSTVLEDTSFEANAVGSQIVELARSVVGVGVLQKNHTKLSSALAVTKNLLVTVKAGRGFHQDGSYVDHKNLPYTGGYGKDIVKKIGDMLVVTNDLKYVALNPFIVKSFVKIVKLAFLPLIFRGEIIAPVSGRSVSRPINNFGSQILYHLLTMTRFGSPNDATKIKEAVKYWMRLKPVYYILNARNANDLLMTITLLNDSTVVGDQLPFNGAKMYASMDRFVQDTRHYTLGLSLYSKRISAFEAGNGENKRGWHTADGAIYLYNNDGVQFQNAYWPTVDPYRIPGTTVDTRNLNDEVVGFKPHFSKEKWVGGVAKDREAVVGMALNKKGAKSNGDVLSMDLKGKKSWFIAKGQIVALGAGITGTTPATIETIVDNRLLNDQYNYKVLTNRGEIKGTTKGISVDWLLLKTDLEHSSIGYYFPKGEILDIMFEQRRGTYRDINDLQQRDVMYNGTYRKFIINHGNRPVNAKYAYVVLPDIKQSELKRLVRDKRVKILNNSARIQAVELLNGGYLGINFWGNNGGRIAGIRSNASVSLMRQIKGNLHSYVLSDPTQTNRIVEIKIPKFTKYDLKSKGIKYNESANAFIVDFCGSAGAGKLFEVKSIV